MDTFSANSYPELTESLSRIDLDVPARGDKTDKRTTAHVERWSICRFLATYGNTRFVRYPLTLEKRERPDFRMESHGFAVGIEITEAVSEDMARIDAMRHSEDEPVCLDVSLFRPGSPRRTTQELRGILEGSRSIRQSSQPSDESDETFDPVHTTIMGTGWAGDGAERDWTLVMRGVIETKAASALKPGYAYFDETWLIIYDNWSFPMLNIPRAMQLLQAELVSLWLQLPFTHIFIEHRRDFVHMSSEHFEARPLNDLWSER